MIEISPRLQYLQRIGFPAAGQPPFPVLSPSGSVTALRMFRVRALGEDATRQLKSAARDGRERLPAESFLAALSTFHVPFTFSVVGAGHTIHLEFGTWQTTTDLELQELTLLSALRIAYPALRIESTIDHPQATLRMGAYVIGLPSFDRYKDGFSPLDELIRSVGSGQWSATVVAEPISLNLVEQMRGELLAELSDVSASAYHAKVPSDLASGYLDLLKQLLRSYNVAMSSGAWRTAVYLRGDNRTFYILASAWKGVFAGDESVPHPLQIHVAPGVLEAARLWALPDTPYARGPEGCGFRHRLAFQSILPTSAMVNYCQLPHREAAGIRVFQMPNLDMEPSLVAAGFRLGSVIRHPEEIVDIVDPDRDPRVPFRGNPEDIEPPKEVVEVDPDHDPRVPFRVNPEDLTKHALVVGSTGSGKTTTLFGFLRAALTACGTFLVIEPAKTEYRRLTDDRDFRKSGLRVFTVGAETIAPLRFNPFRPASRKILVGTHIDLLRAAFAASFGMWAPLPQILERCLHEVYADKGWNLATGQNNRLDNQDSVPDAAWPTLSELIVKVQRVIDSLGYERKVADDMRAALVTRLESLRIGSKGRMLDSRSSVSIAALLERPTILELESLGDDDDKAFVMGLILIQLIEHLKGSGSHDDLRHVLVIEEAHRLLKQAEATGRMEDASPRAKAVETFSNLLSEVRAYGEGVVIVDQSPSVLAPSVIKNTNLKIVHRLVSAADKDAMAAALGLTQLEGAIFSALKPGLAVAMGPDDDRPIAIQVENHRKATKRKWPDDDRIRLIYRKLALQLAAANDEASAADADLALNISRQPAVTAVFARLVLAITEESFAPEGAMKAVEQSVFCHLDRSKPHAPATLDAVLELASEEFAESRGAARGWSFAETDQLRQSLVRVVRALGAAATRAQDMNEYYRERDSLRSRYKQLHHREVDPFPACKEVCPPVDGLTPCRYRELVASLSAQRGNGLNQPGLAWKECLDATQSLVEDAGSLRGAAHTRIALCLAQQLHVDAGYFQVVRFVDSIVKEKEG